MFKNTISTLCIIRIFHFYHHHRQSKRAYVNNRKVLLGNDNFSHTTSAEVHKRETRNGESLFFSRGRICHKYIKSLLPPSANNSSFLVQWDALAWAAHNTEENILRIFILPQYKLDCRFKFELQRYTEHELESKLKISVTNGPLIPSPALRVRELFAKPWTNSAKL